MRDGHFNRSPRDIIGDLQGNLDNFNNVLVIATDKRGGAPKVWGTGSEDKATELLKAVAPEFAGLSEPA